jgi:hypothetical protein
MQEPLVRKLMRLATFVAIFAVLCAIVGLLSIMFLFNVHGGILSFRVAPLCYGLEALAAALIAWRLARIIVPTGADRDEVV